MNLNTVGDGVLQTHLPHLPTGFTFVSIEEQTTVVESPETSGGVGGWVGRRVILQPSRLFQQEEEYRNSKDLQKPWGWNEVGRGPFLSLP